MSHKNTVHKSRAGSGSNMLKGCTLMLVMTLMVMGCDSIVDQQTNADSGVATSDMVEAYVVDISTIECKETESKTVEWGNRRSPSSKTVYIEYYNTLDEFVLRVKSTEMIANVLLDDESIKDFNGTVAAGDWQEFTIDLDEGDTQTFSLKVTGSGPPAYFEVNYTLLGECISACGEDVTFNYGGVDVTYGTVTGANDRCWLDRNLGASRVAESSTDAEAYGDLFQWGRAADGHQLRASTIYDTDLASTFEPNKGNDWDGKFIANNISPFDWLETQDNDLWQGVDGINNPCPVGYRLPTEAEWQAEIASWGVGKQNAAGAYASPLRLPVAGFRFNEGRVFQAGTTGRYWSSTVVGSSSRAQAMTFSGTGGATFAVNRVEGRSVRCLKEDTSD